MDVREIFQDFLDRVSKTLMAGDISAIVPCMAFPQDHRTTDGYLTVTSTRQMTDVVFEFRAYPMGLGTTEHRRVCDRAEADATGAETTGKHMTYVLKDGSFAVAPIRSRMILGNTGSAWLGAGNWTQVSNRAFALLSPEHLRARTRVHP